METPSDLEAAFGYNPNLMRQGQRARVLQEKPSDYQNQHTDVTAFLAGLLGARPDELSGSVMDPNRQRLKAIAEPAFAANTLAQAIPAIGALAKLARLSGLSGSAGNVGSSAVRQIGAIYRELPPNIKRQAAHLAELARAEHPEARVEFSTGEGGGIIKGGLDNVTPTYSPNGVALHTHGYAERLTPSNEDLASWVSAPKQLALGVVRPNRTRGYSAFVVDPKIAAIPSQQTVDARQMELFRKYPELSKKFRADDGLSRWQWFMDKANADDIDLYLHGDDIPRELMYPGYKTPLATLEDLKRRGIGAASSGEREHLMSYLSSGHEDINRALREGNVPTSAYWIDDLIKNAPPLKEDLALWRYAKDFPERNPGYTSTTLDPDYAKAMSEAPGGFKKIIVPRGERALSVEDFAPFNYEREVLLPRGGSFEPIDDSTLMFSSKPVRRAEGGPVRKQVGGPFIGHVAPESNLGHDHVAPGMRKGGLSQIKECSCGR